MPAKRKSTRTAQLAPQPAAQSDYDTDTAALTDTGLMAAIPAPPVRSNTELNLLVLRRWYPTVQSIEAIASFAAIYTFAPEIENWKECDIQGTLFICRMHDPHTGQTSFRVIVLNRKSPENWHYDIVTNEGVQLDQGIIIIQDPDDVEEEAPIYGIWVYNDEESGQDMRQLICDKIMECGLQASLSTFVPEEEEADYIDNGIEVNMDAHVFNDRQQEQEYEVAAMAQMSQAQSQGQRIDINSLFAKPPVMAQQPLPPHLSQPQQQFTPSFAPTPDTDFFRTTQSPAAPQQNTQQNTLLNLFKGR